MPNAVESCVLINVCMLTTNKKKANDEPIFIYSVNCYNLMNKPVWSLLWHHLRKRKEKKEKEKNILGSRCLSYYT